jgi:hypothetical protein
MGDYVSTYALLRAFFASIGQTSVFRRPPSNLTLAVPVLVIARIGGNDRTITLDRPRAAIDAYASDEDTAEALGETVRTAMRTKARGFMYGGAVVGDVATFSGPQLLPWNAPNVFKVGASYQIVMHQYSGVS